MRFYGVRLPGGALTVALLALSVFAGVGRGDAQTRLAYNKGQTVTPAYEGWWQNEDGSYTLFFGYMNTNWEEEFDVPVGPANAIEPGGPDQGQPTHFYPRRSPYLFTIRVPKDFATTTKELVWRLTTNGKTETTHATLHNDYLVDPQVIQMEVGGDLGRSNFRLRLNKPPELSVEGTKQRTVKVGESVSLVAVAKDPDNMPPRLASPPRAGDPIKELFVAPPGEGDPRSAPGLRLSWLVYRGNAAAVTFSPEQMKTWQDTRPFSNSPWSPRTVIPPPPADGKWVVQAKFHEPGTYVLRAAATDSALFTYENVTVTVTP